MQVKIIIGTIAFMLTMIIVGFVALREPARMVRFTDAYLGRSVENGAEIFMNNCSTCHGVNGRAQECYDPSSGEQVGCAGLPLNSAALVCGSRSQRMEALSWSGAKADFIHSTISAGRPWNGMPTWGEQFGGPLQENQVNDVTLFVLNWENEMLCAEPTPEPFAWPASVAELPQGDPEAGQQKYAVTFGCQTCHGDPQQSGSETIAPWLGDIETVASERRDGYTPADYIYESILNPDAVIAPECPLGPCSDPSGMPHDFPTRMNGQDMADVISYLLGTGQFESSADIEMP